MVMKTAKTPGRPLASRALASLQTFSSQKYGVYRDKMSEAYAM